MILDVTAERVGMQMPLYDMPHYWGSAIFAAALEWNMDHW